MAPTVRKHQWTLLEFAAAIVVAAIGFRWLETLPLIIPFALMYVANKTHFDRPTWWIYVGAFPAAWGIAAWFSVHHPGDEYGMVVVGLLPLCGWAARWVPQTGKPTVAISMLALTGLVPAAMYGWALDRARVKTWLFFPAVAIAVAVLVLLALREYPTYQRAMSKNGSLTAYVSAATLLALPLVAILSTLVAVGVNWWLGRRETSMPVSNSPHIPK